MHQFGFIPEVGCETLRCLVSRVILGRYNSIKEFFVIQIDLSNAYDTVNLWKLHETLKDLNFWSNEDLQLWRFLVTTVVHDIMEMFLRSQMGYHKDLF